VILNKHKELASGRGGTHYMDKNDRKLQLYGRLSMLISVELVRRHINRCTYVCDVGTITLRKYRTSKYLSGGRQYRCRKLGRDLDLLHLIVA